MPDFFDEVRAEVRNERIVNVIERYRYHLMMLAVGAVVIVGGVTWYQNKVKIDQHQTSLHYFEAAGYVDQGEAVSAIPRLTKVMEQGTKGWKHLAAVEHALMLLKKQDAEGAQLAFEALIADSTADMLFRDYAVVMSAWLMIEHGTAGDLATAKMRLESMTGENKPWTFTAQELLAMLALKEGDEKKAYQQIEAILMNQLAPSSMHARLTTIRDSLPVPVALPNNNDFPSVKE